MPILDSIASALGGNILTGVTDIIKLFKIPPEVALQHQEELDRIQANLQGKVMDAVATMSAAQNQVNAAEAASKSTFISGWRPFIGWVCGSGLAFQFILGPIVTWLCALAGKAVVFPSLDMGTLLTLVLGMLGLGGMRTFEKVSGVSDTQRIKD